MLKAGDRGGAEMLGIFSALGIGALFKALITVVGLFKGLRRVGDARRQDRLLRRHRHLADADGRRLHRRLGSLAADLPRRRDLVSSAPSPSWPGARISPVEPRIERPDDGIWDSRSAFFGIGAMVVAGIYSIFKIAGSMGAAIRTAVRGIRGQEDTSSLPRTEQGITGKALFGLMVMSLVLSGVVYFIMTGSVA